MRLRLEQRDHIEKRLQAMLVAPRPASLATAEERIFGERIVRLEKAMSTRGGIAGDEIKGRVRRLRGALDWKIYTEYDQRLTEAHKNLRALNQVIDLLKRQYTAFVRTRQAATQSYQGYDDVIRSRQARITAAREKVRALTARQGQIIEVMAVNELTRRRDRLEEIQVKARFALADSYDRASKARLRKGGGQ
jgi:hypothetical protein